MSNELLWALFHLEESFVVALIASDFIAVNAWNLQGMNLARLEFAFCPTASFAKLAASNECGNPYFFLSVSDGLLPCKHRFTTLIA